MTNTWVVLTPILITDLINPVLFAVMVYAAGTKRPVINSTALLLGHTLAYFTAGIVLALGFEQISHRLSHPQRIDYIISLIIGILILAAVFFWPKAGDGDQASYESYELTPAKSFGLGMVLNFIGIPFALPYFAALDQILKADFSVGQSLCVLVTYNLLYALPFMIVPVATAVFGERSRSFLEKMNNGLSRTSNYLMPILLILLGIALTVDAVKFFIAGQGLF